MMAKHPPHTLRCSCVSSRSPPLTSDTVPHAVPAQFVVVDDIVEGEYFPPVPAEGTDEGVLHIFQGMTPSLVLEPREDRHKLGG